MDGAFAQLLKPSQLRLSCLRCALEHERRVKSCCQGRREVAHREDCQRLAQPSWHIRSHIPLHR